MAKNLKVEDVEITVGFTCQKCKKQVSSKVNQHDFLTSSSECDLCGSHGELTVDVTCPQCGAFDTVDIKGW